MGNKIDEFLRKNYHKNIPFEEKYWREAQVLLDPPKKDRRLLWLLLLLCFLMSTYIVYDYFQDRNRIASAQNASATESLVNKNLNSDSPTVENSNYKSSSESAQSSSADYDDVQSNQKRNTINSSALTNGQSINMANSEKSAKATRRSHLQSASESRVAPENQAIKEITGSQPNNKTEKSTGNSDYTHSRMIIADVQSNSEDIVNTNESQAANKEIWLKVFDPLEGIETRTIFITFNDNLDIQNNIDYSSAENETPVIRTPLSPLTIGLTAGTQLNPYASGQEKSLIGAVAGMSIEKEFTHTMSIYSGLLYQMKRGTFTSVEEVSNFSTSGFELETDEYFLTPQSLHYVKVPLQMHKSFGNLSLGAGLSAAYLVGIYGNISSVTGINAQIGETGEISKVSQGLLENENLNKFNFDANLRAEYEFSNLAAYIQTNYLLSDYSNEFDQEFLLSESNPLNLELGIELKL